ncbi:hypothetical protein Y1Q_0014833 [Alligator mississippiensis]|uniref:Uncharacterized protein n=1 Tax=Alligator mississippiensis TaxID=8496 RepID=A0A151M284_ALLMI|nr:hypothetical protein Y1Q_0014833 [Alligator mississippiensis]
MKVIFHLLREDEATTWLSDILFCSSFRVPMWQWEALERGCEKVWKRKDSCGTAGSWRRSPTKPQLLPPRAGSSCKCPAGLEISQC